MVSKCLFCGSVVLGLGYTSLLLAATYPPDHSDIIPADCRIAWQGLAGVPDGIPHRTKIFASVKDAPYRAVGDGATDDTAAIQAAINVCPADQVVYIPAGTYRINSRLTFNKSHRTIRGGGIGQDRFEVLCGQQQRRLRGGGCRMAPPEGRPGR